MPEESLEEVLGSSINKWFGGATIDVHATFDAMLAVMASIAVRAGCNTPERRTTLADHMKTNLAIQLRLEHDLAKGLVDPSPLGVETVEKMVAAGRQALQTEEPVRVELRNNVPQKIFELAPVEAVMPDTTGENAKDPENEAEAPSPMPQATFRPEKAATRGSGKPTDSAGQQGGTHGGVRG